MPITIPDLETWNKWLSGSCDSGCCGMPECPEPVIDVGFKEIGTCGYNLSDGEDGNWVYYAGLAEECNLLCGMWRKITEVSTFAQTDPGPPADPAILSWNERITTGSATLVQECPLEKLGFGARTTTASGTVTITDNSYARDTRGTPPFPWYKSRDIIRIYTASGSDWDWEQTDTFYDEDGIITSQTTTNGTAAFPSPSEVMTVAASDDDTIELSGDKGSSVTFTGEDRYNQTNYETMVNDMWSTVADGDDEDLDEGGAYDAFAERRFTHPVTDCGDEEIEREECMDEAFEQKAYYQFEVEEDHEGTYFNIEWDEVFFPEGWDRMMDDPDYEPPDPPPDPPEPVPQVPDPDAPDEIFTPRTFTWNGPGGREDVWRLLEIPAGERGRTEICNVRFSCYHGDVYGMKVQADTRFQTVEEPEPQGARFDFSNQQMSHMILLL